MRVKNAVSALPGVHSVQVDLASGKVTVEHDAQQAPVSALKAAINASGYTVEE